MMNTWAEMVAAGKDKPTAVASPVAGLIGYDPKLERKRLDFEITKYEQEREDRKLREEKEKKEREDAREFRLHEIKLKEKELQIQLDREKTSQSLVNKTKLYADAMKGSISQMPVEVVHFLTYFKDVERLFEKFEVPDELKAHLLRPYLNEKAKILVSRMDPEKSNSYEEVKVMLLREFQLSPALYQEKFNTETRKSDETCLLYSARLVAILDAYLESRKIDKSYEKLTDLLVADRIKSTLPDGCIRHISSNDLAEAVDLYFANRWKNNDQPRAGALGLPASTKMSAAGGLVNRKNTRGRAVKPESVKSLLKPPYTVPIAISKAKICDLQDLCRTLVIPTECHYFYNSLVHTVALHRPACCTHPSTWAIHSTCLLSRGRPDTPLYCFVLSFSMLSVSGSVVIKAR